MTLYSKLEDPALVRAVSHPLRRRILYILQDREASPKELSEELATPLANVAYHIQVLRKLKLIRLVRKTPRRGAVEHHYRAQKSVQIDDEAWSRTPGLIKEAVVAAAVEDVGKFVTDGAAAGGFDHTDAHLTRRRLVLDEPAWKELAGMLREVYDRSAQLHDESAKRLRANDHEGERRTGLVMMLFETVPEVPNADEAAKPRLAAGKRSRAKSGS